MSDDQARRPNTRRRIIGAAIAIVIGAAVIVGFVVSQPGETGSPATPPTSASLAPTAVASQAVAEDVSICGLTRIESESNLDESPDADWQIVGTVAAPSEAATGPGEITGTGFRSCYAHTAAGALFASANFLAMGTDSTLRADLPQLVAEGPGKIAVETVPAESSESARAQIAGFAVTSYSLDAATIDLALAYSDAQLVSLPIKLVWQDGDWKVQLDDAGALPIAPAPLKSLGGYLPWSGV